MTRREQMDQLFERLLPSAAQELVESARWGILGGIRAEVAAGPRAVESAGRLRAALNYADYHILLVLADGERHGYAIMSMVEEVTEGATKFGPGTLYTSIRRLLKAGLIEESHRRPDPELNDEPRPHYRMTGMGRTRLVAESERLTARLRVARDPWMVRPI